MLFALGGKIAGPVWRQSLRPRVKDSRLRRSMTRVMFTRVPFRRTIGSLRSPPNSPRIPPRVNFCGPIVPRSLLPAGSEGTIADRNVPRRKQPGKYRRACPAVSVRESNGNRSVIGRNRPLLSHVSIFVRSLPRINLLARSQTVLRFPRGRTKTPAFKRNSTRLAF